MVCKDTQSEGPGAEGRSGGGDTTASGEVSGRRPGVTGQC